MSPLRPGRTLRFLHVVLHDHHAKSSGMSPNCKRIHSAVFLFLIPQFQSLIQDSLAGLARRMQAARKSRILRTCEACAAASVLHPTLLWCVGAFNSAGDCDPPLLFQPLAPILEIHSEARRRPLFAHSLRFSPCRTPVKKPATKLSPAPVESTTSTGSAGRWNLPSCPLT